MNGLIEKYKPYIFRTLKNVSQNFKMTTPNDKILEVIKEGNKYILYFLFIFLFIHFAIVIPFKHPVDNSAIGEASKSIDKQLSFLNSSITELEKKKDSILKVNNIDSFQKTSVAIISKKVSKTSFNNDSINVIDQKSYSLQEKRISYQKELIELAKKKEERSFTIPILGISINQSIILSVYPGFILVGLCLALVYRRRLFYLLPQLTSDERKNFSFPLWSAPIPLSLKFNSFGSWLFANTIGLALHCTIIYVGIDFLLFRGNKFDFEILAVNIFIAIAAACVYLITFIQLIIFEWKRLEK